MKNNLYIYACSHGKLGTVVEIPTIWKDENTWGDLVSKKLDFNPINRSQPGGSNFHIFKNIFEDIVQKKHKKDDIIIVQWSHINRAYTRDNSYTVMPHHNTQLSKIYYSELYDDLQSLSNVVGYTSYLKTKIKSKFYFSSADWLTSFREISSVLTDDLIDSEMITINDKTPLEMIQTKANSNKELLYPCSHASDLGHSMIADIYFNYIKDKL
jgi:hypothetical protein